MFVRLAISEYSLGGVIAVIVQPKFHENRGRWKNNNNIVKNERKIFDILFFSVYILKIKSSIGIIGSINLVKLLKKWKTEKFSHKYINTHHVMNELGQSAILKNRKYSDNSNKRNLYSFREYRFLLI